MVSEAAKIPHPVHTGHIDQTEHLLAGLAARPVHQQEIAEMGGQEH
jgi:hypothetical protein